MPIAHRWAGIWGQTFDLLPFAGRLPGSDRLWVAGGYSGHGNVLGFACGDLVAKAILGEAAPELGLFDPGGWASSRPRAWRASGLDRSSEGCGCADPTPATTGGAQS